MGDQTAAGLADLDARLASELEKHVLSLSEQFEDSRDATSARLSELGAVVNAKADKVFMAQLEQSIRDEVSRLRQSVREMCNLSPPHLPVLLGEAQSTSMSCLVNQ